MVRKTKIIATMGPAVASAAGISELVAAGIDVARLNFSHGTQDEHRQFAGWVRQASEEHERAIGLLQDIQGPRIRVGRFPGGTIEVGEGEELRLRAGVDTAAPGELFIDHLEEAADLDVGHRVLIADGSVQLEVSRVEAGAVYSRVLADGVIGDRKGVSFPDTHLSLPIVTDKDLSDLEFGASIDVDIVAASFVSSAEEVRSIRKLAGGLPVIAKIERAAAYEALDDILEEADGAMVARGDLGVELSLERVPLVQKDILERTNVAGRLTITATEMLDSMTSSSRPTRAEVADVANAVLDGTDAVMLSAETAVGSFPPRAVEVMDIVCRETEAGMDFSTHGVAFLRKENPFPSAIAKACVEAADSLDLPAIIAFTESGATARLISKYRPQAPILCFSALQKTRRQMSLYWGVRPLEVERFDSTDEMIENASQQALRWGLVGEGDGIVMVAGIPPNQQASTNLIKLHIAGSEGGGMPRQ